MQKALQNAEQLKDPDILHTVAPLQVTPFISAFQAMNKVVEVSFSNKKIEWPKLEKYLTHLKKTVAFLLSYVISTHQYRSRTTINSSYLKKEPNSTNMS